MRNFKDLFVWQKSIELVVLTYKITKEFPQEEKYGLAVQMRRAAISIPSNIAEGHMRRTIKDFKQFLTIARGSCAELETQTIIASNLTYITHEVYQLSVSKIEEVSKMLASLSAKL
ncbi:MAG: four helix bundle protein [Parcubacteria group bacterium RIFCSPLOWO2_01_FULL_48_18]|nr:MAG: four helix bundle protein [Parcubacteria group bacterium RIFCSPLOWO2_01_FULL_48_18]OHB23127.1 MAG: four helix bundle protein [Parcubacteria group bacterium RIFCSPHIGHO2_02_FULL_48_10b]